MVKAVLKDFVAMPESYLNTDSSPAYTEPGKEFRTHRTVVNAALDFLKSAEVNFPTLGDGQSALQ